MVGRLFLITSLLLNAYMLAFDPSTVEEYDSVIESPRLSKLFYVRQQYIERPINGRERTTTS